MDRTYILGEIKRTADANKGTPLGKRKFETETGIKEADWFGKYWSKWGDAVKEAGFLPNQLQRAYEDDILIAKFVDLIKDLGKYPARSDVRMRAHTHPGFPAAETFKRRGSKARFAERLVGYCRSHPGLEEVLRICEAEAVRSKPAMERGSDREDVYLIKSGRFYKIGRSNAPGRREWELGIKLPEKVHTIHTIRTDDPPGIEAYWHLRFKDKRRGGEWFDLDSRDVSAFKRRKFQ